MGITWLGLAVYFLNHSSLFPAVLPAETSEVAVLAVGRAKGLTDGGGASGVAGLGSVGRGPTDCGSFGHIGAHSTGAKLKSDAGTCTWNGSL
jgi:hypothetical protein